MVDTCCFAGIRYCVAQPSTTCRVEILGTLDVLASAKPESVTMFSILDRYIGATVLKTSLMSLIVLTGLSGLIRFVEQLKSVGRGSYEVIDAALFVFYSILFSITVATKKKKRTKGYDILISTIIPSNKIKC